tara:strand:+ start:2316 stop:2732 length:417 start_codon:yes stop_codon:yes gene_type:complete
MLFNLENIHPLIIHFPIALLSTALLFDILASLLKIQDFKTVGLWCMITGTITCFLSNFTGLMIFLTGGSLQDLPKFTHAMLAWLVTVIFVVLIWLRIKLDIDFRYSRLKKILFFCIYIVSVVILFYGSHLGAKAAERI